MNTILKFLKRYNEFWLAPLALILYVASERFLKAIDPEAVPYTLDAFQKIIFGHLVFATCSVTALLCIRLAFPIAFKTLVDEFEGLFIKLSIWEKLKLSFWVFASYLLGLILCMQVL